MNEDNKEDLQTQIANMYYIEGMGQKEIAARLSISRASVSRLLHGAQENGIVSISVRSTKTRQPKLAQRIREIYRLNGVYIAESSHEEDITCRNVANLVCGIMEDWLRPDLFVGISSGKLIYYIGKLIQNPRNIRVHTVQLLGNAFGELSNYEGTKLLTTYCRRLRGDGLILNAPIMLSNRQIRDMLYHEPTIASTIRSYDKIDIALFEIGNVINNLIYPVTDVWLTRPDTLQLEETHAVGSLAGLYFDLEGNICSIGMNDRRMGISMEDIKRIPHSVGVSYGDKMLSATKAALNSRLINELFIDESLAIALST